MIVLMIIGIVLLLGGAAYAVFGYRMTKHKLIEVEYKKSTTIKECAEILTEMGYEGSQYVEMNVKVDTDFPLTAPISKKQVIEYSTQIKAVYKKTVDYKKPDGTVGQKEERSEKTVFHKAENSKLCLRDSSCDIRIEVSPDFSASDFKKSTNYQSVSPTSPWGQELIVKHNVDTSYLTEFVVSETILLCGETAYALGDVKKEGDAFTFKKPVDKKNVCALTLGSESSFGASLRKKMKKTLIGGIAIAAAGILVFVLSFFI